MEEVCSTMSKIATDRPVRYSQSQRTLAIGTAKLLPGVQIRNDIIISGDIIYKHLKHEPFVIVDD